MLEIISENLGQYGDFALPITIIVTVIVVLAVVSVLNKE